MIIWTPVEEIELEEECYYLIDDGNSTFIDAWVWVKENDQFYCLNGDYTIPKSDVKYISEFNNPNTLGYLK